MAVIPEPSGDVEAVDSDRSTEYIAWLGKLRAGQAALGRKVVAAYVEFGADLIAAKESVPHGEWYPLLDELGIDHTKAGHLMNIARHEYIANPAHAHDLPAGGWTPLAELARLNPDQVAEVVDKRLITAESLREDVVVVVKGRIGELPPEASEPKKRRTGPRKQGIGTIARFRVIRQTTVEEIEQFVAKFPSKADELDAEIEMATDQLAEIKRSRS